LLRCLEIEKLELELLKEEIKKNNYNDE